MNQEIARFYHEKAAFLPDFSTILLKRLQVGLSEKGVIFISIDDNDNEQAQLKMLCDEVFEFSSDPSKSNNLATLIWNLGTGTQAGHFTRSHEYVLVYVKNKLMLDNFSGGQGIIDHSALKKISIKNPSSTYFFPKGVRFDAPDNFELYGTWGGSEKTTLVEGQMVAFNGKLKYDVVLSAGWAQKNQMKEWFSGKETIDSKGQKVVEFYFNKSGVLKYAKDRSIINPKTVLTELGSTKTGSSLLTGIIGNSPFDYPKSLDLIKFLIGLQPSTSIIFDFFAGSGTTLHATMQLNSEDGGNRQCIMVTNNENNICEEVTYERNRLVIQGYNNSKGEWTQGLTNNNLRYYRSEFVPSLKTEPNKRLLTQTSTDLLCIKEDCYTELTESIGFNPAQCRIFTNDIGRYLMVVYHSRKQLEVYEQLIAYIKSINDLSETIKLYAFSPEKETLLEDFAEVADKIDAVPLPEAIYNAYRATFRTLKLDKKPPAPTLETTNALSLNEESDENKLIDLSQDQE